MRGRKVDLFLGGPLGLWVLDNVDPQTVGDVHTCDTDIGLKAQSLGLGYWDGIHRTPRPVGLSVHYPRLLSPEFIDNYEHIYNIHPGYLPWGRCYYPVFWALWADEPAGCTLHEIDAGIDTGPVVERCWVPKYDWDTGGTLHQRVRDAEKGLFLKYWPIIAGGVPLMALPQGDGGSSHTQGEFLDLKANGRHSVEDGRGLLRLIQCLSHKEYTGMLYSIDGRQYEVSMRPVE